MNKLFFMHIPKCGGTSIKSALRNSMKGVGGVFSLDNHASKSISDIYSDETLFGFRAKLTAYAIASNHYKLVMGHSVFSERLYEEFNDTCDFFTIVREPIKRFISHYTFNKEKKSEHFKNNVELDEFLDSKEAIDVGSFYLRYFSGLENKLDVENAKTNIEKFSFIGDLDHIDHFCKEFKAKYDIDLEVMEKNKNPSKPIEISDLQMSKIRELCARDIEIYNFIRNKSWFS